MGLMRIFKKRSIEEIKQPQEYYCSNLDCTNEAAQFSTLVNLLTDDAFNKLADFYCIDCITEGRYL